MRIVIASGKGGTGKTTVAINLALSLEEQEEPQLVDADVEEPNAHLFLHPQITAHRTVTKLLPAVDEQKCTACGACAEACQFNALSVVAGKVLVFDQLCHGCGRCTLVCPERAIAEVPHKLGIIETGTASSFLAFAQGLLRVGEAMATPIIHALGDVIDPSRLSLVDAPPGTGCPTIAAMHSADLALLVTEPTPFGLHDLRAAIGVANALDVPVAVVINRDGIGDDQVDAFCRHERIPVIMRIPFRREIAAAYAIGEPLVRKFPEWVPPFRKLYHDLKAVIR
ncbi:ATP-binding protein [Candidatus Bipolaricaulota bacterium]|nr:ATP-binding protein [Candidatus Bipolaricaulota bacterium]